MPTPVSELIRIHSIRRRAAALNALAKNAREGLATVRARAEQRIIDGECRRTEAALAKAREAARSNERG
jgi:hypothetical protein